MSRWLQHDHGGTLASSGDGRAKAAWRGPVHNHIRLMGGVRGKTDGEKQGCDSCHVFQQAAAFMFWTSFCSRLVFTRRTVIDSVFGAS
jgi:hypothetical protein